MSSKPNTNSSSIAHADAHLTNEIIKYGSVDVKPMVDMWPSSVYNEKLKSDLKLLEYDSLLRSCYTEVKLANFSFEQDNYGGYEIFYRGGKTLKPRKFYLQLLQNIYLQLLAILKKYPIVQLIASLRFQCFERLKFLNLTE